MTLPNMRHVARECVDRAKHLLSLGDEPSVRHACLELRFAIEYLSYDLLQVYRDEIDFDAVKKWQPKAVISEMRTVDEYADKSNALYMGPEVVPGEPAPEDGWRLVGEENRMSMEWANKNYGTLGNFLHAPTIDQLESGKSPTLETLIKRANIVLTACEQILNSRIYNCNFGNFFTFTCGDCGSQMKGRVKDPSKKQVVTCRNGKCGAIYDATPGEGERVVLILRKENWVCPPCGTENWIGLHCVKEGNALNCAKCGHEMKVDYHLIDKDMRSWPDRTKY